MTSAATRLFFVQMFVFAFVLLKAQEPLLTNQQRYGVDEGLPMSFISGIIQDKDGFLWLSTLDGLSRYDGRGFKNIRYKDKDTTGLSGNAIYYMLPQTNNKITLIYDGFMADEFDMRTTKVRKHNLQKALSSIPGAIWKLYNLNNTYNGKDWLFLKENYKGIGWRNTTTGNINYANKANGLLQQDTLSAFLQTPDGKLYLVSEDGVHVSDAKKENFTFIAFPTSIAKIKLPAGPSGFLVTKSVALLAPNKLAVYDTDRIVLLDLSHKTVQSYSIPVPAKRMLDEPDAVLKLDTKGQLYFKHSGRIFRMNDKGEMKLLWENKINPVLHITAFYIDRSDVLWASVNAQGLVKVDLQVLPFQSYRYQTNFVTDVLLQAGVPAAQIPAQWSAPYHSYYLRSAYDSKGNLYISCNYFNHDKVYRYNQKSLTPLAPPIPGFNYSALAVAPNDEVRVFDENITSWFAWPRGSSIPYILMLNKPALKDVVLADARYIGGYYWLTSYSHGLFQFKDAELVARFEGPQSNGILTKELTEICPDPKDQTKFWIGSRGGGLILWDVTKGLQKVFTTDDGLPNNTVYCILPDKNGKIWCSTNKGIFRFDPITQKVLAFEKTDGLAGNEFNRAHKFLFADGRMAFGGIDGYTIFNPADFEIPQQPIAVPIQITALQINNRLQDFRTPGRIIPQPLTELTSLKLPHHKNYLRIEFAAMLYNQPLTIKYRYKLLGADEDWIDNGTNNIAAYTGLQPGQYTFQVNATDNNGLWSNTIKQLSITINPPFWATWWAYAIYIILTLVLTRMYLLFREKRLQTEQSLAFEKREAIRLREMEEVKDRFFSNITHEFRTPLSLITTPLEILDTDPDLPPEIQKHISTARKNAKRLLKLINEFLDFSKLNNGQLRVNLSTGELQPFMKDLVQTFETAASEKDISISLDMHVDGLYRFDEEKWEKILTNLLSNAIKFTPVKGKINVLATVQEDDVGKLEVSNTGPGIPLDQQQKVFERFYQAQNGMYNSYGGTGIGLSLVKELTELMGGSIGLVSEPGAYTTFTLLIPAEKAIQSKTIPIPKAKGDNDKLPVLLIAEDNEELRHFLVESLEQSYHVLQAMDGAQAWNLLLEELPDVVISDVMMPEMDGFELCRLAKSDMRTAHIGFMLLTSKGAHEALLHGLGTGADDYITKPFHLAELELRVANLLQNQQKIREHLQHVLAVTKPQEKLPSIKDEFLKNLYAEMEAKLDDPQLGVDYLCQAMGMSRSTLNRKLKALLDTSTNDLIRQYRLQRGAAYLTSGLDIASVAYKVGFSSPSYFSQCFREQFGMTPSDYLHHMVEDRNLQA